MPLPSSLGKIVGKPWTAWVSLAGGASPSELTNTHSRRLNRSEISIFGSCPTAERLTLVPCPNCGDRFKQAALGEHVRTRHGGAKKPVVKTGSPDKKKSPLKKGKHSKLTKEKAIIVKDEPLDDVKPIEWSKNDDENHRSSEREIPVTSVLPQFMLQASSETVKEGSSKSSRDAKSKQKKFKLVDSPSIESSDKSPSQKRDVDSFPIREKIKADSAGKKAKIDVHSQVVVDGQANVDVVVAIVDAPQEKAADKKKKTGKTNARGGRVYDADIHCGVVGKESSRPCTRSLICKLHSITLRKAVKGRSKPFDVLVSAVQREKELERNKLLSEVDVKVDVEEKPSSPKDVKAQPNDSGKFSLPVSIKNPNLWSQLQSRKSAVVEVAKTSPSVAPLRKGTGKVITGKEKRREGLTMNIIPRTVHVNGFRKGSVYDGFLLPGYRRNNGLLTTSVVAPKFKDVRRPRMNAALKPAQKGNYLLYLNNAVRNSLPERHRGDDAVKFDSLKPSGRNVVSAAQMSSSCPRRGDSPSTAATVAVTKPVHLYGPVNGSSVLPLGLTPPKTAAEAASVDLSGAGLSCDDAVRLDSPRPHFFPSSGKQSRPKLYLPNSAISASPSGIVCLQRTLKTAY